MENIKRRFIRHLLVNDCDNLIPYVREDAIYELDEEIYNFPIELLQILDKQADWSNILLNSKEHRTKLLTSLKNIKINLSEAQAFNLTDWIYLRELGVIFDEYTPENRTYFDKYLPFIHHYENIAHYTYAIRFIKYACNRYILLNNGIKVTEYEEDDEFDEDFLSEELNHYEASINLLEYADTLNQSFKENESFFDKLNIDAIDEASFNRIFYYQSVKEIIQASFLYCNDQIAYAMDPCRGDSCKDEILVTFEHEQVELTLTIRINIKDKAITDIYTYRRFNPKFWQNKMLEKFCEDNHLILDL